jgi:hypothetical protein
MSQFNPLEKKCIVCGEIISYSKADWKEGKIPEKPICGNCIMGKGKKSGLIEEIKVEGEPFMGEPVTGKKWERRNRA